MIWYVSVFLVCVIAMIINCTHIKKETKHLIEILILIILILFSGTRYKLGGWDYEIYHKVFTFAPTLEEFSWSYVNVYDTEIGFVLLNSIIKSLGFNFYGFTLFHSILFYALLYRAIKKLNINFNFFIVVFLYKTCIFNTFVSMRQSLVLVIFLNSLLYLKNNKKFKYLLSLLPCLLLHTSSIILFPLVFIDKIKFTKRSFVVYGLIFFFFFVLNVTNVYKFNFSFIMDYYGSIFSQSDKVLAYSNSTASINILSTIEVYIIWLFFVLYFDKLYLKAENLETRIICNLFFLCIPLTTIFRDFEIMIRFRDYFMVFEPFVLYYILNCFERKSRFIYVFVVTLFSFIGFYRYIYTYDDGKYSLKNYKTYLLENVSVFGGD